MRRTSRKPMPTAGTSTTVNAQRYRPHLRAFDVFLALAGVGVTFVWSAGIAPSGSGSEPTRDTDALWVWASLLGLAAGPALHSPVHELGHVLAAAALRLQVVSVRVWHLRFGRPDQALPGTYGHVAVELPDTPRWLPVRMILFSLGGPAANVCVSVAIATTVVANQSVSIGLRSLAVGLAVAGFYDAIVNLNPRRRTNDHESDGRAALQWILRTNEAHSRVGPQPRRAPQPWNLAPSGARTAQQRRDHLLSEVGNNHPDIAVAAMRELLTRRPRWDDGWQDFAVVATFAAREDLSPEVRSKVSSQYSLSLALAYLVSIGPGAPTEPQSPKVRRMEQLAELALAANNDSLQSRTAMALVRIIQERSAEARALLSDVESSASPAVQARANAVRGIAELKLGDLHQARRLAAQARRITPTDSVVKLLHVLLTSTAAR